MEGMTRDYSESFESDLSSDNDSKSPHGYLSFFTKISDDLQVHFSRNSGKEDYCKDIYEDIYSTPISGSYSYYKDLVDAAQKSDARNGDQKKTRFEFHEQPATPFSEFFCSSACSGHFNPTVGAGPFEELFQVLEPTQQACCLQALETFSYTIASTHCSQNSETMAAMPNEVFCNPSLDDGYSDFIDIFNRWTSDGFPTEFSSCSTNNF
ncbi:unnamed protein product [Larinioides sclopetarius]|uniref:Uncharacterized protein n=1 Tax=Larinioides sclopetarius TaxID=280406 RepID=A0AAV1Z366_9ARAC